MAEKYVELATSLSNAQNMIKNLDIAKQNLKNSEKLIFIARLGKIKKNMKIITY